MAPSDYAAILALFRHVPDSVLATAARGELDLNTFARVELVNRGLDRSGVWVGFDEAQRRDAE